MLKGRYCISLLFVVIWVLKADEICAQQGKEMLDSIEVIDSPSTMKKPENKIDNPVNLPLQDTARFSLKSRKPHWRLRWKRKEEELQDTSEKSGRKNKLAAFLFGKNISKDSITHRFLKRPARSSGSIAVGYDYGVIPFAANANYPMGYYHTEGNVRLEVFRLPVSLGFYYSGLSSISGLNNYFRVSFDKQKYLENINKKFSDKEKEVSRKLEQLYAQKQSAEQQLYYLKSIKSGDYLSLDKLNTMKDYPGRLNKNKVLPGFPSDSIALPALPDMPSLGELNLPEIDSVNGLKDAGKNNFRKKYLDSLSRLAAFLQNADSVRYKINEYEGMIKQYEKDIQQAKQTLEALKSRKPDTSQYNPFGGKLNRWMSVVKKTEIGLCYPNSYFFLINGITIKGLNVEVESGGYFVAATYGKTINNLLYTSNPVQNSLSNTRNLYNFFDFSDVRDSRRVAAFKFGMGRKEETHLHIGLLYGLGQASYISTTIQPQKEQNYVVEIDGKWVINTNHTIDLVYGKSSVQQNSVPLNSAEKGFNALLHPERSHAALLKYTMSLPKTKTRLVLTGRWLDPFFKSYGVMMRSDNLRYEAKGEQSITAKIKVSVFYRKEEDNLLSLYYYSTALQTLGSNVAIRFNKQLTLRAGYIPVVQRIKSNDGQVNKSNRNNISNVLITYSPKIKYFRTTFNGLYSYYHLTGDSQTLYFQNINITNTSTFRNGLQNNASANWFSSSQKDTFNNHTTLLNDDVAYTFKNGINFSVGIKLAISKHRQNQIGYSAKITLPIVKRLFAELSGEKLVLGDFYNSYNPEQVRAFPYYVYAKLIYNW